MNIFERASAYKDGLKTLMEWTSNGGEVVAKELAEKRAAVCSVCPLNVKDWVVTDAVAEAIRRHVELKNHLNLTLTNESSLHTCSACGCVIRLKAWLPLQQIYPTEKMKQQLDPKCWLLNE